MGIDNQAKTRLLLNKTIRMRILIIDDDSDDIQFFREAILKIDPEIECLTARDGDEGLTLLRRENNLPHFIFLDVNMPVMDGRECLIQIKRNIRYKNIQVVVYSTTSLDTELTALKKLGARHVIFKSASHDDLVERLKNVIQANSPQSGAS
jgi:CheY-like chemotaxis protein